MTARNVSSATMFVVSASILSALVFTTMLVPSSIGIVRANPCSTNGGDGGNGGPGGSGFLGSGGPGGPGGNGGDAGDIGECTVTIEDSVLAEP